MHTFLCRNYGNGSEREYLDMIGGQMMAFTLQYQFLKVLLVENPTVQLPVQIKMNTIISIYGCSTTYVRT